jgi:hypothetical protein
VVVSLQNATKRVEKGIDAGGPLAGTHFCAQKTLLPALIQNFGY